MAILLLVLLLSFQGIASGQKAAWKEAAKESREAAAQYGINSPQAVAARKRLDHLSAELHNQYPDISNRPDPRKTPYPTPQPIHPQAGPAPDHRPNGSASN